jgi:hypothetical protein
MTQKENNELVNLADYDARTEPDYLSWKESHRIGCAEYVPESNYIHLWIYNQSDTPYAVNLATDSFEKWLEHIFHKTWATSEVIGDFVRCYYWIDKEEMIDTMN